MSENLNKLKKLLAELFQLDQADLDFGIYRIMNTKRDEITHFLDSDLLPQVQEAFQEYRSADRVTLQAQLDEAVEQARKLGADPETLPRVKELREKLAGAVDVTALENEVYSHLYNFFRRYYHEGDFISLRRYKEGVYAIPYEGEEVKLHWANHDQYYIKTTEYFRDYAFRTPGGHRAHFKIVEADTEKDNVKAANGNERRFLLHGDKPVAEEGGELVIRFEYRMDGEKRRQDAINAETARRVTEDLNDEKLAVWQHRLSAKWTRADGMASDRTNLEKHLYDYTRRNTFDYFIHKDLGGFLRRELDFYIKNEVMRLDDVEEESAPRVDQYLSKIKVIRRIAHKVIDFLAQIEGFQKKLWLKKKFVVETNYCVTLDRVPEDLYPEIAANDAQREEWVRLFAIDEIKKDLAGAVDYSESLTVEFLKANPFLVLDTKFFGQEFKDRLLANCEDIETQCDGLLVHAENLQTLILLSERFQHGTKCAYLDPPYNTSEETFIYKNEYQHSSWATMMRDRIAVLRRLLDQDGVLMIAIDDEEAYRLKLLTDQVMGGNRYIGTLVVQSNPRGRGIHSYFATSHDYCLCYAADPTKTLIVDQPLTEEQAAGYRHEDNASSFRLLPFRRSGGLSTPDVRPNSEYSIYYSPREARIVGIGGPRVKNYPEPYEAKNILAIVEKDHAPQEMSTADFNAKAPEDTVAVMPADTEGRRRVWRWSDRIKVAQAAQVGDFVVQKSGSGFSIQLKDRIKEGRKPKTMWYDSKYDASSHGTNLVKQILGERGMFGYPKSFFATRDALHSIVGDDELAVIVDVFAGSGTTGHAAIDLNRSDDGKRKYVLGEMGAYFDTVLVPRIQKVVYSKDWKDGKPVSREGVSHMFKYIRLESYEDTLNNLEPKRTEAQQRLIEESPSFRESYMLSYMLDVEGRDSLLNIDAFEDPFNYKLNISTGTVGETKPATVDLVETFNYLLGLTVHHIDHIRDFRVIQGTSPNGEKVLVIWRNLKEKSNEDLDEFFRRQEYNPKDMEFDLIYVNGDNNLENLRREDETWKVRLIEEDFKRLMFDVEDV